MPAINSRRRSDCAAPRAFLARAPRHTQDYLSLPVAAPATRPARDPGRGSGRGTRESRRRSGRRPSCSPAGGPGGHGDRVGHRRFGNRTMWYGSSLNRPPSWSMRRLSSVGVVLDLDPAVLERVHEVLDGLAVGDLEYTPSSPGQGRGSPTWAGSVLYLTSLSGGTWVRPSITGLRSTQPASRATAKRSVSCCGGGVAAPSKLLSAWGGHGLWASPPPVAATATIAATARAPARRPRRWSRGAGASPVRRPPARRRGARRDAGPFPLCGWSCGATLSIAARSPAAIGSGA